MEVQTLADPHIVNSSTYATHESRRGSDPAADASEHFHSATQSLSRFEDGPKVVTFQLTVSPTSLTVDTLPDALQQVEEHSSEEEDRESPPLDLPSPWIRELQRERFIKSGWLSKLSEKGRKSWKKRWFVLRQEQLAYYKDETEYSTLGIIPARDIHSVTSLTYKAHEHTIALVTHTRTFYLEAPVQSELHAWLNALEEVLVAVKPVPSLSSLTTSNPPTTAPQDPLKKRDSIDASLLVKSLQQQGVLGDEADPVVGKRSRSASSLTRPEGSAPSSPAPGPKDIGSDLESDGSDPDAAAPVLPTALTAEVVREIALKSGWLWRYEHRRLAGIVSSTQRVWKRRWVVLRRDRLTVYKDEREYVASRILPLTSIIDVLSMPDTKGLEKFLSGGSPPTTPVSPTSDHGTDPACFQIVVVGKTYHFGTERREDMALWVQEIRRLMQAAGSSGK